MRKIKGRFGSFLVVLLIGVIVSLGDLAAYGASPPKIIVNGVLVDTRNDTPQIRNGTTFLPLRATVEALNCDCRWEDGAVLTGFGRVVTVTPGSTTAKMVMDGQTRIVGLKQPAYIDASGRTFIPLRFLGEAFGLKVDWDPTTKTVEITSYTGSNGAQSGTTGSAPETEKNNSDKNKTDKIKTEKINQRVTYKNIEIRIKKVQNTGESIKVFLDIKNDNKDLTLRSPGQLKFKLENPKYENELNNMGYNWHFGGNDGYIYPGDTRDGYYEYLLNKDVEIEEITYYLDLDTGVDRNPVAAWIIE